MRLTLWPPRYGVGRLPTAPTLEMPGQGSAPVVLVATGGEMTLVAPETVLDALAGSLIQREDGWRLLTLAGEFPFETVGVLARLTRALAEARVSMMAYSSFSTDHLLVREAQLGRALAALAQVSLPV